MITFNVAFSVFYFTSQTRHETTCFEQWKTNEKRDEWRGKKNYCRMCRKICFGIVAHCSNAFLWRNSNSFILMEFLVCVMLCSPIPSRWLMLNYSQAAFFLGALSFSLSLLPPSISDTFSFFFSQTQNGMRDNHVKKKLPCYTFLVIYQKHKKRNNKNFK